MFNHIPKLSILIPAFNYPSGLIAIFSNLQGLDPNKVEVIVFDDSSGSEVKNVCSKYSKEISNFTYRRNDPPLGAANNWNSLLDRASGEYLILLHHDEFLVQSNFVELSLDILQSDTLIDVLVPDLLLYGLDMEYQRRHLPFWFRKYVSLSAPSYMFRRNVIGAPSGVIVRRNLYPRFDDRLSWFIDVDMYYRLFKNAPCQHFSKEISIGSTIGRSGSITETLQSDLDSVVAREYELLERKYPEARVWVFLLNYRVLRIFEGALWAVFRVVQLTFAKASTFKNHR